MPDSKAEFSLYNICVGVKNFEPSDYFSVGIHPWYSDIYDEIFLWKNLLFLIEKNRFSAIGEIGLDKICGVDFNFQKYIFEKQLMLAADLQIPVIIHCVRCYDILLFYRKKYAENIWILHDFNGNLQIYSQFLDTRTFFSFGNNFMREKSKIATIFSNFDVNRIFFETDTKSFSIEKVYEKASKILKIDIESLERNIFENFLRIF